MTNYIIVPYRDRKEHWNVFVNHYTKLFPTAKILRIEQGDDRPFNRGFLLNVGAVIGLHEKGEKYYTFHDVDMIADPKYRSAYAYPETPTHIATKCSQFGYKMPYAGYFGGVTLFNEQDLCLIGGFSNSFWGWGGEDDDLMNRCLRSGLTIQRRWCRFESLAHKPNHKHDNYLKNLELTKQGTFDGISDLSFDQLDYFRAGNVHCYKVSQKE